MTAVRTVVAAVVAALAALPASRTAAAGSAPLGATETAIVEAVRPSFEWLVGGSASLGSGPASFARLVVRVKGDWAYVRTDVRRSDGSAIDPATVPSGAGPDRPVTVSALLIRRSERWYLVDSDLERDGESLRARLARYRPPPGLLP